MAFTVSKSSNFYKKKLSAQIDSAIAGLTANSSTKLIFTTQTPNGGVNPVYVRSTTCWAKNIDLSPLSPWNSAFSNLFAGTLISPRHIVGANHSFPSTGATLIFVDMNNNCYTRTLSNQTQISNTDIQIGVLNSDLPTNVSFCKVASFDLTNLATNSNRIPVLYTDQEEKALVGDFYNSNSSAILDSPADSQRASFYETPIDGDSGDPIGFIFNNKIILLFTFFTAFNGPSLPYYINEINSAMINLGGGYTLSIFNKEDISSQEKNISIKKQNATFLKPYSIDGGTTEYDANAVYIFKGGSTNTVSTVFNYLELTRGSSSSSSDMIFLSSISAVVYYKGSGIGGQGWRNASTGLDATNLVINDNEIIYFTPISNKQISVSSGAIIQRYSNGKMTLKKN